MFHETEIFSFYTGVAVVYNFKIGSSTTKPVLFYPQSSDRMDSPSQSSTGKAGQKPLTCVDLSL